MSNASTNIVNTGAMPAQQISPLQAGATSPMNASLLKQQAQIDHQMALIGKSGGSKKIHLIGGNTNVVQVPQVQSGSVNPQATSSNYIGLTKLSQDVQTQSAFDGAKTAGDTATIETQQRALYKTGGTKRKIGGSWGCFSGGKHKRRTRKNKKNMKNKKNKKNKKTKTHL